PDLPRPDDNLQRRPVLPGPALLGGCARGAPVSDVIEQFWRAYLYTSNGAPSGLAVTLWLLVLSVGMGFFISIFLAVARVSSRRYLSVPLWCFGYVFRGTPLYVQILFIYAG